MQKVVKKRCYEFRDLHRKMREKQKPQTYIDYLKKSEYNNKEFWIKFYENNRRLYI